jgi:hypothetical protein
MIRRFSLIFLPTFLFSELYTIIAVIKITGESKGNIKSIGIANTPMTSALTIAFALYCSGVISILALLKSFSSSARLYSLSFIIFAIEFSRMLDGKVNFEIFWHRFCNTLSR